MRHPETERDRDLAINSLKSIRIQLSDSSRHRLAVLCREAAAQSGGRNLFGRLAGVFAGTPLQAASAAALVLLTASALFLWVSETSRDPGSREPVRLVSVAPTPSGGVTLEWKNGNHRVYKVLRSNNPRDFTAAQAHAVLGNRWTDENPSSDRVVYYKVE